MAKTPLGEGREGDRHERDVPMPQVDLRILEVIGDEATALAARLPARIEHEVVDDQLAASVEQLGQRDLTIGSLEHVILNLDGGHALAPNGQRVPGPAEFLLGSEQLHASLHPLFS